ncbi:hypothetical protein [Aquitalea pelogenes]|uniref:hypothetical protein n=1 Tax=Aquitalea pelogenes TaxID=1293573 RepID=UPI000787B134|nr:hypothetical protein [Aquitalea pelogenes]
MEFHPVIEQFRAQAEILEATQSTKSIDEATIQLAIWMDLNADRLSVDDMALLTTVGGILFREGLNRRFREQFGNPEE